MIKIHKMNIKFILLSVCLVSVLLCEQLNAQTKKITVTGTIKEAGTKLPMVNASVATGNPLKVLATADAKGNFTILVEDGATLTVTYVSYERQVVKLKPGQTVVNIVLKEVNNNMDEIVVRGY